MAPSTLRMEVPRQDVRLPRDLELKKASFYRSGASVSNLRLRTLDRYDACVVFDYHTHSENAKALQTVIGMKMKSPKTPVTNLSRSAGIQLERVGEWVLAWEPGRWIATNKVENVIDEVLKLLEYAKEFPQNV